MQFNSSFVLLFKAFPERFVFNLFYHLSWIVYWANSQATITTEFVFTFIKMMEMSFVFVVFFFFYRYQNSFRLNAKVIIIIIIISTAQHTHTEKKFSHSCVKLWNFLRSNYFTFHMKRNLYIAISTGLQKTFFFYSLQFPFN